MGGRSQVSHLSQVSLHAPSSGPDPRAVLPGQEGKFLLNAPPHTHTRGSIIPLPPCTRQAG